MLSKTFEKKEIKMYRPHFLLSEKFTHKIHETKNINHDTKSKRGSANGWSPTFSLKIARQVKKTISKGGTNYNNQGE